MFGKGGGGGRDSSAFARQQEAQRQNAIRSGMNSINSIFDKNFNDDFYGDRRQAYLDYATPQLDDQFSNTKKQLTYWLDSRGLLDSSVRAEKEAELQKLYDTQRRSVNDQGLNYETTARDNVENARASLIRDLTASADAGAAVSAANNRIAGLSAPEAYSPLADMFGQFTNALATQASLERTGSVTGTPPRYNTGLFGVPKNSVVVQ